VVIPLSTQIRSLSLRDSLWVEGAAAGLSGEGDSPVPIRYLQAMDHPDPDALLNFFLSLREEERFHKVGPGTVAGVE
jgi:hypothetical protein